MSQDITEQRTTSESEKKPASSTSLPFKIREGDDQIAVELDSSFVRSQAIYIDTGSLQARGARDLFLDRLLPLLQQSQRQAAISQRTIAALQAASDHPDATRAQHAKDALAIAIEMTRAGCLSNCPDPHEIPGDPHDTFGLFCELFIGFQMGARVCLITQNESAALQIVKNSRSKAFERARTVRVAYVEDGQLKNWVPRLLERAGRNVRHPSQQGEALEPLVARGFQIVADTSSLLLFDNRSGKPIGAEFFGNTLLPELERYDNVLIVPLRVTREMQKHALSDEDSGLRPAAEAGLAVLHRYIEAKRLNVGEDEHEVEGKNKTFADPVFVRFAVRFQGQHDLCFITQDTALATLLLENRIQGGEHQYLVTYVDFRHRKLMRWEPRLAGQRAAGAGAGANAKSKASGFAEEGKRQSAGDEKAPRRENPPARQEGRPQVASERKVRSDVPRTPRQTSEPFALPASITPTDETPVRVSCLPGAGDTVVGTTTGSVQLVSRLAEGGEGTVYRTNVSDVVCKIYHEDKLTASRRQKLELMVTRNVRIRGVCWPTELVHNLNGEFVGYLMPKAEGTKLNSAVLTYKRVLTKFPHWTREHLTQLAITVLRTIERLHALNILVGDINQNNILVVDENTISIIDVDSFQVEGYPCPVGTDTFTPPERQGQSFTTFLRSKQDELFAVTTLLFMILFNNKAPYSSQGGGEAKENIRNRRFPYARQVEGERNIKPVGAYAFIWSHLHPRLKDDFIKVFANGERVAIDDLIKHLSWAKSGMREGKGDREIVPTQPRLREGATVMTTCELCPPGTNEHEISESHAQSLQEKGMKFLCSACLARKTLDRVENTRDVVCAICGCPSAASLEHLKRLAAKKQAYWCHKCAEEKKKERERQRRARAAGKACFVATATYQSEDAPEVEFLRAFRDGVLREHGAGRAFIDFYYRIGPALAAGVERFPRLRPLCRWALDGLVRTLRRRHPTLENLNCIEGNNHG